MILRTFIIEPIDVTTILVPEECKPLYIMHDSRRNHFRLICLVKGIELTKTLIIRSFNPYGEYEVADDLGTFLNYVKAFDFNYIFFWSILNDARTTEQL